MAEALDTRYAPQPSLQEGFLDKDTGLPLVFGLVFSYANQSRTTLKPIFTLQETVPGGPVNYIALPNPIVLSGIGTIQDANGNDVIPYFFPYDANGNVELYYIEVTDQFGVRQFTREAFPNIGPGTGPTNTEFENFIPNGQFLIHNAPYPNTPSLGTQVYQGLYSTNAVSVAPGGWSFEVSSTSASTYKVTFVRSDQFNPNSTSSPRYEVRIQRTGNVAAPDTQSDLRIKFMDVFKFTSADVTPITYTLLFSAISNTGSTLNNVQVYEVNDYGTSPVGGTAAHNATEALFSTTGGTIGNPFNITTTWTEYAVVGNFIPDQTAVVGDNDNDFVQLAIRFPAGINALYDVTLTDFMLVQGEVNNSTVFPVTTNGQFLLEAISNIAPTTQAPGTPDYYSEDGSNLYLPMIMTPGGMTYDYGQIGTIMARADLSDFTGSVSNVSNELIADGKSYLATGYSTLGIPFSRLAKKFQGPAPIKLRNNGTGSSFANFNILDVPAAGPAFGLYMVSPGLVTSATAGTTTFIVSDTYTAIGPGYGYKAGVSNSTQLTVIQLTAGTGAYTGPVDGTGGAITFSVITNAVNTPYVFTMTVVAFPAAGTFFRFQSNAYYVWFTVDGVGADPAPGGIGIKVNLLSTWNLNFISPALAQAISNRYEATIEAVSALNITSGQYWTFQAKTPTGTQDYFVWYKKDGIGTIPSVAGIGIEVDILTGDSANTVAIKTMATLNDFYVGVPDMRGYFLRGADLGAGIDPDSTSLIRYQPLPAWGPNSLGSYELSSNLSHNHPGSTIPGVIANYAAGGGSSTYNTTGATTTAVTVAPDGTYESRPVNVEVAFVIKY